MIQITRKDKSRLRFICDSCKKPIRPKINEGLIFFNRDGELIRVVHRNTEDNMCDKKEEFKEPFYTVTEFIQLIGKDYIKWKERQVNVFAHTVVS